MAKEDIVNAELQKYTYDKNRLEVVNTTRSNRDCRTSGECDQKKERLFHRSRNEDGKGRKRLMHLYLPEVPEQFW